MSLINDALKKAQQQRASSPATTTSVPGAQPKKKSIFRIATVIGLCAIGLSAISVGTTLFILHDDSASPTRAPAKPVVATPPPPTAAPISTATGPLPTVSPSPTVVAIAPAPSPTPIAVAQKPVVSSVVVPPGSTAMPASSLVAQPPATIAFPASQIVAPAPAPTPAPAPLQEAKPVVVAAPAMRPPDPTQPSPGIQTLVDKLRVAGIRVSDTDSKVILNEHLFRLNDLVEPGLGLRLTTIDSHVLTFTDGSGFSYQKRF